jgi:hypothetical protein
MIKEGEEVAGAAGPGGSPPRIKCGSGHSHKGAAQAAECDDRLAQRARLKTDAAARREVEAPRRER